MQAERHSHRQAELCSFKRASWLQVLSVSQFGIQEGGTITSDDPNSPLGKAFGVKQERPTAMDAHKGMLVDPFSFNFPEHYRVNWWQDTKTPDGKTWRVKLTLPYHASNVAPAEVAVIAADGSELEEILVTNPATPYLAGSVFFGNDRLEQVKTVTRK